MFYLCCSGVRHDVTYGHSHTMCESNCRYIISVFISSMNVLCYLRQRIADYQRLGRWVGVERNVNVR